MCDHEHQRAVGRLSAARAERGRLADEYTAAAASQGHVSAQTELRGARAEVTARERWLEWLESDGPVGLTVRQPPVQELGAR
jgi:hypothetical protein